MTPTLGWARFAWAGLVSFIVAGASLTAEPVQADGYTVSTPVDPALAYGIRGTETLGVVSIFGNDWFGIPYGDRSYRSPFVSPYCCRCSIGYDCRY